MCVRVELQPATTGGVTATVSQSRRACCSPTARRSRRRAHRTRRLRLLQVPAERDGEWGNRCATLWRNRRDPRVRDPGAANKTAHGARASRPCVHSLEIGPRRRRARPHGVSTLHAGRTRSVAVARLRGSAEHRAPRAPPFLNVSCRPLALYGWTSSRGPRAGCVVAAAAFLVAPAVGARVSRRGAPPPDPHAAATPSVEVEGRVSPERPWPAICRTCRGHGETGTTRRRRSSNGGGPPGARARDGRVVQGHVVRELGAVVNDAPRQRRRRRSGTPYQHLSPAANERAPSPSTAIFAGACPRRLQRRSPRCSARWWANCIPATRWIIVCGPRHGGDNKLSWRPRRQHPTGRSFTSGGASRHHAQTTVRR